MNRPLQGAPMNPNSPPQSGPDTELPLEGVLVVALEQAVAAPYCSSPWPMPARA